MSLNSINKKNSDGDTHLDYAYDNDSPIEQRIIDLIRSKGGKANYYDANGNKVGKGKGDLNTTNNKQQQQQQKSNNNNNNNNNHNNYNQNDYLKTKQNIDHNKNKTKDNDVISRKDNNNGNYITNKKLKFTNEDKISISTLIKNSSIYATKEALENFTL